MLKRKILLSSLVENYPHAVHIQFSLLIKVRVSLIKLVKSSSSSPQASSLLLTLIQIMSVIH